MANTDFRQHVLRFYDHFAWTYDVTEWIRSSTRQKAVKKSNVQPGETVLDVCTGTGELALAFARAGAHVTAIDLAVAMLNIGARKATPRPVTWLPMDATQLEFADKHFDIVTLSLGLHHMPREVQLRVLGELNRVARKKIILVEPHAPYNKKLHTAWGIISSVADRSPYIKEWARQDFTQTCRDAGLQVEEVEVSTLGIHRIVVCKPV